MLLSGHVFEGRRDNDLESDSVSDCKNTAVELSTTPSDFWGHVFATNDGGDEIMLELLVGEDITVSELDSRDGGDEGMERNVE